jgi:hypothetical protein
MPILPPPPAPPKKETIAVRLDVRILEELRRYAAVAETKNYSHIIAGALERLFDDNDYKTWLKVHPDFHPESKPRRKGASSSPRDGCRSGQTAAAPASPAERHVAARNSTGGA